MTIMNFVAIVKGHLQAAQKRSVLTLFAAGTTPTSNNMRGSLKIDG